MVVKEQSVIKIDRELFYRFKLVAFRKHKTMEGCIREWVDVAELSIIHDGA
jgi:hypothetical protein